MIDKKGTTTRAVPFLVGKVHLMSTLNKILQNGKKYDKIQYVSRIHCPRCFQDAVEDYRR